MLGLTLAARAWSGFQSWWICRRHLDQEDRKSLPEEPREKVRRGPEFLLLIDSRLSYRDGLRSHLQAGRSCRLCASCQCEPQRPFRKFPNFQPTKSSKYIPGKILVESGFAKRQSIFCSTSLDNSESSPLKAAAIKKSRAVQFF